MRRPSPACTMTVVKSQGKKGNILGRNAKAEKEENDCCSSSSSSSSRTAKAKFKTAKLTAHEQNQAVKEQWRSVLTIPKAGHETSRAGDGKGPLVVHVGHKIRFGPYCNRFQNIKHFTHIQTMHEAGYTRHLISTANLTNTTHTVLINITLQIGGDGIRLCYEYFANIILRGGGAARKFRI